MNQVCNFLAYLRNQCYGLRKFNYVFVLKMSAFGRLRQGFAAATAATALFATPACAQQPPETVQISANANTATACATDQRSLPPPDALALSNNCDAVIYYNEHVSAFQAEGSARSFRNIEGYDVIAVRGFPGEGQVVVLRNGALAGNRVFDGDDLGQVGAFILDEMDHRLPTRTAQVTEASFDN